ncbi:MAG: beta-ketoacyl-[acyl-carrier-protein] synthase family protein [Elusimicrobiota bacterium]|jgi:3-oxoacyl-[acyl-carrier-protein] synthase II|nr:beta-ketoacyl-[acyl-carrier-protein] synthase family protein [Elusimicrobiota bacterium]
MLDNKNRIVITGCGSISPYGAGVSLLTDNILAQKSSVKFNEELAHIQDLTSLVSSTVPEIDFSYIPRHFRRSMSKMSLFAYGAIQEALDTAGFKKVPGGVSLFIGSTISSMQTWLDFSEKFKKQEFDTIKTTVIFQVMNHSPLANMAQAFDLNGLGLGVSAACATGLMNIGLGYLAVKAGFIDKALCGGTDEYHPMMTGCFAIMNAASNQFNDNPDKASRPFDSKRCGIVCSEGAGIVLLETLDSALKRNAQIYGEILGFGTNTETKSISHPSKECISRCMQIALKNANVSAQEIDFINAHATSTVAGDIEESKAVFDIFGGEVWTNSLKGHIGHTMAASGALELISMLDMMKREKISGTLNLDNIDEQAASVKHFSGVKELKINTFIKNSFALGGTNCSLIVRRFKQ